MKGYIAQDKIACLALVDSESIVRHQIRLGLAAGRHVRLKIEPADRSGHFVKIARSDDIHFLRHELFMYEILQDLSTAQVALTAHVPELVHADLDDPRMVSELATGACNFREHLARVQRFDPQLFRLLGRALGTLHLAPLSSAHIADLPRFRPWLLSVRNMPISVHTASSPAQRSIIEWLQNEHQGVNCVECLHQLTDQSRATTLVHADLKWDNVLLTKHTEASPPSIQFVDWEFAGVGNPLWDVGTILSELLATWALSIPIIDTTAPDAYIHLAGQPLEQLQPAIRSFWDSYSRITGSEKGRMPLSIVDAARAAAGRLIQTAYERVQTATHLTPHIDLLLRLGQNIMEHPEVAVEGLFGIPVPTEASD